MRYHRLGGGEAHLGETSVLGPRRDPRTLGGGALTSFPSHIHICFGTADHAFFFLNVVGALRRDRHRRKAARLVALSTRHVSYTLTFG